ncbi:YodC family protein [Spirosoma lituiforme]
MQTQFKLGDLVQLKSGGPIMTVSKLIDSVQNSSVECVWFNGTNLGPLYATFLETTLVADELNTHDE